MLDPHANLSTLTPEESEIATLRQAVEWVAFKLPPLTEEFDKVFRSEGSVRLMYCKNNHDRYCVITEAHQKLFTVLRKGLLPATAVAINEIEKANYHKDIPHFRTIRRISGTTEISCRHWGFDKIFWSENCLAYDDPDACLTKTTNNIWLLARGIWVDTSKLYALFPPESDGSIPADIPNPINVGTKKKRVTPFHEDIKKARNVLRDRCKKEPSARETLYELKNHQKDYESFSELDKDSNENEVIWYKHANGTETTMTYDSFASTFSKLKLNENT